MARATPTVRKLAGLAVAAALLALCWTAWESYPQFANVARWTGDRSIGWLRNWLTEFRTALLCVAGFLLLSAASWILKRIGIGC